MNQRLYRWWLYRGPGLKRLRRLVRQGAKILPPGFEVRDSTFTGKNALEAAAEVDRLRSQIPPHYIRDIGGEVYSVTINNPVNTSLN